MSAKGNSTGGQKNTKGNPVFLGFAIVAIVAAMVIFAILLSGKKKSETASSRATQSTGQSSNQTTGQTSDNKDYLDHTAAGALSVTTLDGETYDLTDFGGKIVILDFWATWCKPCLYGIPHFIELQKQYEDENFMVLGLSTDRSPQPVKQYRSEAGVNFPMAMATKPALQRFGPVQAIPTTFVIDHNNKIRHKKTGYADKAYWEEWIKKLIAERDAQAI